VIRAARVAGTATLRFTARIRIRDINPYLLVSAARARVVKDGWRRPMPVLVRINGKPARSWRINMMPAGNGAFYLYLHGDVRKAAATKVGDRVEAEVRFDERYRNGPLHPMPRAFAAALRREPAAAVSWRALTPSRKKEVLRYLAGLKSTAALERNIAKTVRVLAGERGRFMAREWVRGT
jgi:Bacteriocin-protection, YdeI or OmpD-Associated/Domain of unknown function (DUF1905)